MKQKLHHEFEGSTSYRCIRLKVLLCVFSSYFGGKPGLPQNRGLCVSPHVLKATSECPRPTRTESLPKSSSGDLGTAADVVVSLIQRIFVPVTVNDGLDEFRSFVCPANEARAKSCN